MQNFIDIITDLVKLRIGMAVNPFWGIKTPSLRGSYTNLTNGVLLGLSIGVTMVYKISFFKLKTIVAVLGGFLNTPIAKASIEYFFFFLTLAVKTVVLSSNNAALDLFVLTKKGKIS